MDDDSASFWADIKEYEERLGRNPDSYLFARLAEIYLKVGLVDDALHIARQGVARYPDYIAGLRALAWACHAKGLQDEARAALEKVTLALPEDGEAQRMLGRILAGQGDIEAAGNAFRIALEFDPDDVESRIELESLERGKNQIPAEPEEAAATPDVPVALGDHMDTEFAAFEDETEELEEIIEDLEILDMDEADLLEEGEDEGVGAEPAAPGVAAHDPFSTATLAGLYVQQGFIDRALDIYRAILVNDPDNADVRLRIADLEGLGVVPGGSAEVAALQAGMIEEQVSESPPVQTDAELAILEGWLDNIRRLKECR